MNVVVPQDADVPESIPPPRSRAPLWAKLWSLVIVANAAGFLVAVWVARLVRAVPDSGATEQFLRFGYFAAMLIVAFVDALLLDELIFKGAFRRSHLQGKTGRFAGRSDDVESVAASMQRSTVSFPFLLLVCAGLTYLGFNVVNRDFDVYYRRVGSHISALEQAEEPKQIQAVAALSIRREPEVVPALRRRMMAGGVPGTWAAWSLGRFSDLPTRKPLLVPLVAAARGDEPQLRREAAIALGRLQHRSMAGVMQNELRVDFEAEQPIDLRLFYALGSVQVMSSVELLEEILHRAEDPAQRMAAWALAQHRDQRGGRAVVKILEDRLATASPQVACAIVHSLGILADEQSNLPLLRFYRETPVETRAMVCPRLQLDLKPSSEVPVDVEDRADLFMPQDTLAMKVIMTMAQMRATSVDVRAEVEPWLVELISDPSSLPGPREAARQLLTGIRGGRDDTEAPSIDEALGLTKRGQPR